ncbi:MAG: hypothetical protein K0S65_1771, partial [Labilithrix sp.]|nr:hypothetical protein [Labilithrix sp.]
MQAQRLEWRERSQIGEKSLGRRTCGDRTDFASSTFTMARSGLDVDGDGRLADTEAASTMYVCNGTGGKEGKGGAQGQPGLAALMKISDEPAGTNCGGGGKKIDAGMDDD